MAGRSIVPRARINLTTLEAGVFISAIKQTINQFSQYSFDVDVHGFAPDTARTLRTSLPGSIVNFGANLGVNPTQIAVIQTKQPQVPIIPLLGVPIAPITAPQQTHRLFNPIIDVNSNDLIEVNYTGQANQINVDDYILVIPKADGNGIDVFKFKSGQDKIPLNPSCLIII